MSFIQPAFVPFFVVVAAVYWMLPGRRAQNVFLLLASYVFYGWMSPWMTALLAGVSAVNYAGGRALARWPERSRPILWTVVALCVANLCVFKYYGWFAAEIAPHLGATGVRLAALRVALPLGLSFYTFHNLSYTIDVSRGRFAPRTDALDYFLYGSYFPQLVMGPVERPGNLLPQLEAERRFDLERVASGVGLALWGAFKKVALADALAPYVDVIFGADQASSAMIWAAALGFTVQSLADFSGYTDIARGVSRIFGIELGVNFAHPYLAATPMEFWQRWHMSFSSWLRDYIYMPACFSPWVRRWLTLPGLDGPSVNTARALLITMLVSGLWHGSRASLLLWGLYYAVLGTIYAEIVARIPRRVRRQGGWRFLTVPLMFAFTVVGMHIFREPSIDRLFQHLRLDPREGSTDQWAIASAMLGMSLWGALPMVLALGVERVVLPRLRGRAVWPVVQAAAWALLAACIVGSARVTAGDFIYFQF